MPIVAIFEFNTSKGRVGGNINFSNVIRFSFVQPWVISCMALQLDLDDRYDLLTDFGIFRVTVCLWDFSEHSCLCVFSFLTVRDISAFCCTTFCISREFLEILVELDEHRQALRLDG